MNPRKRPLLDSPNVLPPSSRTPLAQRIRSDFQISEAEIGSPERELLRTQSSPEKSPSPCSPPNVKSFSPPAPLAFTPIKTKNEKEVLENVKAVEEVGKSDTALSCQNCEGIFTTGHQCGDSPAPPNTSSEEGAVNKVEELPPPLPLCLYCCHRGSGKNPVHYFMQCVCSDRDSTCWCYCTEAQSEHKKLVYPGGFGCPGYPVKTVKPMDRPKAKALAEARTFKLSNRPCENPSCIRDFEKDRARARALGQL